MNIAISSRQRSRKVNPRRLREITKALLMALQIESADLGIVLVGARKMALLNETFLRHEGSTDVITFDYAGKVAGTALAGEIFICVDEAVSQAKRFQTTWQSEMVRYIVHGVLHLLGHDDLRAKARQKMKREENRRLRELSRRFALSKL